MSSKPQPFRLFNYDKIGEKDPLLKHYLLKLVAKRLAEFSNISYIARFDDNLIRIEFDRGESYYFDLSRGQSKIFKRKSDFKKRHYQAPFDRTLQKLFTRAKIQCVDVFPHDRILTITAGTHSSYKKSWAVLQLEFTGKNTNAIILNENEEVIEALRHIDLGTSFREVRPGRALLPLPERQLKEKEEVIEDIDAYLENVYAKMESQELERKRTQALTHLQKRIDKLRKSLEKLDDPEELQKEAETLRLHGELILSSLYRLNRYDRDLELEDYDGNPLKIRLPDDARSPKEASQMFFDRARRLSQKAKNLHIEQENLSEKADFVQKMLQIVTRAKKMEEISPFLKNQERKNRTKGPKPPYESLYVGGFKVSIGKNQKENSVLLRDATAEDIWLHVQDFPSSHTLIHSGKQRVPEEVLMQAAKLCVEFSGLNGSQFSVDYTRRKFVRIREGAKVFYTNFKTVQVLMI